MADLVVNGQGTINGRPFWRIDNLEEEQVGLAMLQNPWALVRDREAAEELVKLYNEAHPSQEG